MRSSAGNRAGSASPRLLSTQLVLIKQQHWEASWAAWDRSKRGRETQGDTWWRRRLLLLLPLRSRASVSREEGCWDAVGMEPAPRARWKYQVGACRAHVATCRCAASPTWPVGISPDVVDVVGETHCSVSFPWGPSLGLYPVGLPLPTLLP